MSDTDFLLQTAKDPNAFIAFAGEMMLAKKHEGKTRWSVTFDIAIEQDSHPFNKYTGKANGKQGTIFKVLLVEVADDGQLVNQNNKPVNDGYIGSVYDKRKGKALVKESGILRNNLEFQKFLYHKLSDLHPTVRNDLLGELPYKLLTRIQKSKGTALRDADNGIRFANHMVHYLCSVHSCKEFEYNKNAATEFTVLMQEFIEHSKK